MRYQVRMHPTLDILVSSIGEVFVPATKGHNSHWTFGSKNGRGYLMVMVSRKQYQVHRLVSETFIPNPNNYPTVDHINRIKTDNRVENLRWATHSMQQDNRRVCEDSKAKYGVRKCEDSNAYLRALRKNNPEYAERQRECMRKYRARKKTKKEV